MGSYEVTIMILRRDNTERQIKDRRSRLGLGVSVIMSRVNNERRQR